MTQQEPNAENATRLTAKMHRTRMGVVRCIFLIVLVLVGWRLVKVQLYPDSRCTAQDAGRGHVGFGDIVEPRGRILDSAGRVLASEGRVESLWANPGAINDPADYSKKLSALLGLDEAKVLASLTKEKQPNPADGQVTPTEEKKDFEWVKRRLSEQEVQVLRDSGLLMEKVLDIREEADRIYPEGPLAAHALGFVNHDGNGGEGLELLYNDRLKATPGRRYARKDSKGRLLHSRTLKYEPPTGGEDLYLTIDKNIQYALERELEAVRQRCNAGYAMGMLMEPNSGAILAMAYVPTFDPNHFYEYPPEIYMNRPVVDVFEPGSSFKIVTATAALEHGLVTPDTPIDCEGGAFNPYGHRITDTHKLNIEPFSSCFAQSSNIAIIKVAAMVGKERLSEWVDRFGFGHATSCDFRKESVGMVHPMKEWSRLSMGSIPMGHEIAVTMPQLARAYCAIANGGYLVEPYLVERAVSREGIVTYQHDASKRRRVMSDQTSATMRELCHLVVVAPDGTGRYANIKEYRVGGKTGTALLTRPDGKGYESDRCTGVFAGFAPLGNPRLCGVIVVNDPQTDIRYGGYICGPVFRNVVREALIDMNCPEDPVQGDVPEYEIVDDKVVKKTLVANAAQPEPAVEDPDMLEMPVEDLLAPLDALELVAGPADPNYTGPALPNFHGLTKSEARTELAKLGLDWDARGNGWVMFQEPAPGTPLRDVTLCHLTFSNKRIEATDDSEGDGEAAAM